MRLQLEAMQDHDTPPNLTTLDHCVLSACTAMFVCSHFKGPARVYNSEQDTFKGITAGEVQAGEAVVCRCEFARPHVYNICHGLDGAIFAKCDRLTSQTRARAVPQACLRCYRSLQLWCATAIFFQEFFQESSSQDLLSNGAVTMG